MVLGLVQVQELLHKQVFRFNLVVLLGKYDIGDYFMGKNIFDSEVNSSVKFHEVSVLVNNPKNNNPSLTSRVNYGV